MTHLRIATTVLGILLAWAPDARSDVAVRFVEPQRFTDAGAYGAGQDRTLDAIERHLKVLGTRCLAAGQEVEIRIHDIDLAGYRDWQRPRVDEVRVMRDVTWPRMNLSYVWKDAAGSVLGAASERLSDMNYLSRSAYVRMSPDPFAYDEAMLTDLFNSRFCGR